MPYLIPHPRDPTVFVAPGEENFDPDTTVPPDVLDHLATLARERAEQPRRINVIEKVVSGGQTGADQAGLRAARIAGIATGGWAPKGYRTERGPAPWLADFGLAEHPSPNFPDRTEANVRDSDGTILFAKGAREGLSPGTKCAVSACKKHDKPHLFMRPGQLTDGRIRQAVDWCKKHNIRCLNVAGHRESSMKGIGEWVETFLGAMFEDLASVEPIQPQQDTAKKQVKPQTMFDQ